MRTIRQDALHFMPCFASKPLNFKVQGSFEIQIFRSGDAIKFPQC